jgi:hypothetical protein
MVTIAEWDLAFIIISKIDAATAKIQIKIKKYSVILRSVLLNWISIALASNARIISAAKG